MAGRYGRRSYKKDEDLDEGDVWNMMEERENSSSPKIRSKPLKKESSFLHLPVTAPRMIPRSSSSSLEASSKQQFSAPVDIPDWSKIYGKTSKKTINHDGYYANDHYDHNECDYDDDHVDGNEDDDDGDGMVPPHEYLARKLSRSQISSFSVYEGIGRTLKGRDLSKLRNAILTKTGFLE